MQARIQPRGYTGLPVYAGQDTGLHWPGPGFTPMDGLLPGAHQVPVGTLFLCEARRASSRALLRCNLPYFLNWELWGPSL